VGKVDGINAKYLSLIQRADGYDYATAEGSGAGPLPAHFPKERPLPPREYIRGHPQAEVGEEAAKRQVAETFSHEQRITLHLKCEHIIEDLR
jgi:hypothetical protein